MKNNSVSLVSAVCKVRFKKHSTTSGCCSLSPVNIQEKKGKKIGLFKLVSK